VAQYALASRLVSRWLRVQCWDNLGQLEIPACVAQVEQHRKVSGVGHGSMRDGALANQLATLVEASMQFVPKMIIAVFSGRLGIDSLSHARVHFPAQRHRPSFYRLGFLPLVALNQSCTSEASTICSQRCR